MTTSLALFCLTVFSTLYRYRWHIRLVLYEAFRGGVEARRRRLENGRFQYDVFVSFDADDLLWVRERLVPQLEQRLHLRLCLHDRDFIPGRNIIDNIEECVETSKKVLMVFSPAFARSEWCQFELALCLRHAMDNDDVLVVALLKDIPPRDLTPAMKAVMKTTTYIQWADEPDAVASFWGRMEIALEEILPAV
nr:hypothetical protein BaRGS_018158 [Batillaria attramentaria]